MQADGSPALGVLLPVTDYSKNVITAGRQWLAPVSLAPWEAEIRRIEVRGQPRQIVLKTPSPK
jgi:hypothetical protein